MPATTPFAAPRPCLALLGSEPWRAAKEFFSFRQYKPGPSAKQPPGDGHPVVIFPGLATDGSAVAPLRNFCQTLGYEAMDWGRGYNTGPRGDFDLWLAELLTHTSRRLAAFDKPATLIGWSLGGFYARELAKQLGPRVKEVITIGTPFNAEADSSRVGWLYRLLSGSSAVMTPELARRLRTPPALPTTSIYSRSDGIVAWQTCCHAPEQLRPDVQDVEVKGSHIGMAWNPQTLKVVADRLAQPHSDWQPYHAT